MFIAVITRASHWSLSRVTLIQSVVSQCSFVRPFLLLSSFLCLCLPNGLFPQSSPTKILYAFRISPVHSTCSDLLTLLDLCLHAFTFLLSFIIQNKLVAVKYQASSLSEVWRNYSADCQIGVHSYSYALLCRTGDLQ
jgi:hypothetical protein